MTGRIEVIEIGETNRDTFSYRLAEAVRKAGRNGVVQLPNAVFATSFAIYLPKIQVTIRGSDEGKTTIRLQPKSKPMKIGQPGLINVGANGSVFENLRVDTSNAMKFFEGSCAINTGGYSDVEVRNCEILNSGIGVGTPDNRRGRIPHGLICRGVVFKNCKHGIFFNRVMSVNPARSVKQMKISDCSFMGQQDAGISIDCGNDGLDGHPNLGDLRSVLGMDTVTNMDGMEVSNCSFSVAKKYNLALAKVSNVHVFNNTFEGAEEKYGESINIEHEANEILIENNTFLGNNILRQMPPDFRQSHISILTFRDYLDTRKLTFGIDPKLFFPGDGCRNIVIRGNSFEGDVTNYVIGEYASKICITNNFTNPSSFLRKKYNFWIGSRYIADEE